MSLPIAINSVQVAAFCQKHHIRNMAFFGSILGPNFRPDSDVDVLVEFESDNVPGFFALMRMEMEFSALIGREADFRTVQDLSKSIRDEVVRVAITQYAA